MKKLVKFYFVCVLVAISSVVFGVTEVWVSWEGESLFRTLAEEWETETGKKVKLVYIPELEEKLTITLKAGGELPDICLIKNDNLPMIVKYIKPVKTSELNGLDYHFDEHLSNAFLYNSQSYVIPFYADMQLMYLSTKVFEEIGLEYPDTNWHFEEFLQIMETIKENKVQPSGWGINSAYLFTGLQEGLGSPVINENGDIDLLTRENIKLLKSFKEWYDSGLLFDYVNRPNIVKAFSKGQLAMFPQGSFLIQKFLSSDVKFIIRPLPHPWKSVIDPKGFVCFNNEESTISLLKKFMDANEIFAKRFIKYPAVYPQCPEEIPYYFQMLKTIQNGMIQPVNDQYIFGYWPAMSTSLDLILKEGIDIQETLERAQSYIDQR